MGMREQPVKKNEGAGKLRRYKCRQCGTPFKDYALSEENRFCTKCKIQNNTCGGTQ